MPKVSDRLKHLREQTGMTQGEFAKMMGLNRMTVNYYENGKSVPDVEFAIKCADYYGVTLEYICGRTEIRNKEDIAVTVDKATELVQTLEKLPQDESVRLMNYLIEALDKAQEYNFVSGAYYILDNCFISLRSMVSQYDKLFQSITPPILELKRRGIPTSEIEHAVNDKPRAIYDAAFSASNSMSETFRSCAEQMVKNLEEHIAELLQD